MQRVQRRQSSRLCAAIAPAALSLSISSSVSVDGGTDDELKLVREAVREQAAQWVAAHPQGRGGGSPDGRGRADDAPDRGAHGGRAPDGGSSPDKRGRPDGWVDGDRCL
jgi:hypothetical protein